MNNDTTRAALAQALDALQHACDAQSNPGRGNFPTIQDFGLMRRAAEVVEAALATPEQEPVAQPGDWLTPTTALHRMAEAVTLLCSGRRPPDALVSGWLDGSDDGLQDFAADNGPAWAQGIGLLDAARIMAEQPTEGVDHQEMPAAPAQAAPQEPVALDVTLDENATSLLRDILGNDDDSGRLRLLVGSGHSGHGLYAADADRQSEGAVLVCATAAPARAEPTDEQIDAAILAEANRLGAVAEMCNFVDYDPEIGRVQEHWVPSLYSRAAARAVLALRGEA